MMFPTMPMLHTSKTRNTDTVVYSNDSETATLALREMLVGVSILELTLLVISDNGWPFFPPKCLLIKSYVHLIKAK